MLTSDTVTHGTVGLPCNRFSMSFLYHYTIEAKLYDDRNSGCCFCIAKKSQDLVWSKGKELLIQSLLSVKHKKVISDHRSTYIYCSDPMEFSLNRTGIH